MTDEDSQELNNSYYDKYIHLMENKKLLKKLQKEK